MRMIESMCRISRPLPAYRVTIRAGMYNPETEFDVWQGNVRHYTCYDRASAERAAAELRTKTPLRFRC